MKYQHEKYQYGDLGKLIVSCSSRDIQTVNCEKASVYNRKPVKSGHFVFTAYDHDTGTSLVVLLIHPDTGEAYTVINGDYWKSEATYGFNKFIWNKGAWDDALLKAIEELQRLLTVKIEAGEKTDAARVDMQEQKDQARKEKFEALFLE